MLEYNLVPTTPRRRVTATTLNFCEALKVDVAQVVRLPRKSSILAATVGTMLIGTVTMR